MAARSIGSYNTNGYSAGRMKLGSLFSGAGALDLAVETVFAAEAVWHCENDPAASKVLTHHWPDTPNLGDIALIDWATVEPVGILCGGFPCTDVSAAGRRAGLYGTRSGLWTYFADAIAALRPPIVVIENVRGLLSTHAGRPMESDPVPMGDGGIVPVLRAAGAVLGDLADLGYDAQWATVAAADIGAPHRRERVFILATDTRGERYGRLELLPTPTGRDGRGANQRGDESCLHDALLPTPTASDSTGGGTHPDNRQGHSRQLIDYALLDGSARWGKYEAAIHRWEQLTRPAPPPTEPNTKGNPRLSAAFSEWMMGWPAGWVTNVPGISRKDQLRIIGNGVVSAQAIAALAWLIDVADCGSKAVPHPKAPGDRRRPVGRVSRGMA